jgi:orotidine-5'-phosphate decarboxylase
MIVSATQPHDLVLLRSWAPTIPFLIPGLGVQEGDLDTAVQHGMTRGGVGPIISVTRAIIYAGSGPDYARAVREAAAEWATRIRVARAAYVQP